MTTPGGAGTSRKEHGFDLVLGLRSGGVLFAKALRRSSSSAPKASAVEVRSLVIDQLGGICLEGLCQFADYGGGITVAGCRGLCRSCGLERPLSPSGGGRGQWRRPRGCARSSGCRLRASESTRGAACAFRDRGASQILRSLVQLFTPPAAREPPFCRPRSPRARHPRDAP
jgi:hypothetical protein